MRGWLAMMGVGRGRAAALGLLAVVLACAGLWLASAGSLAGAESTIVAPDYNPYVPLPEKVSTYAGEVDSLFMLILWITGITFILTEALLVYTLLMFRHREGHKSQYIHGSKNLEIAWTVVPALILVGLAIYQLGTWKTMKMSNLDPKAQGVLHVQVMAKQFEWNFRYAGADGKFGKDPAHPGLDPDDLYSTGALVIPVNTKIVVEMRSTDVIHSLFLPYFRFKQDLMPGMTVFGWFEATKTTADGQKERNNPFFNYEIACAELCGPNHGKMRANVIILSKEDFEAWKVERLKYFEKHDMPPVWMPMKDRGTADKPLGWDSPYALGQIPEAPPAEKHHE